MGVTVLLAAVPGFDHEPPSAGLSGAEIARMRRYMQLRDRWLFVAARLLLRHGLASLYGISAPRMAVDRQGRPFLESGDVDFNFSHTDGLVACAFGRGVRVGVDVEGSGRTADGLALAARFFAPAEHDAIAAAADVGAAFLRVWTLKEAVAKAVGLGLGMSLADFTVALDPARVLVASDRMGRPTDWQLAEHHFGATHQVAVAVRGEADIAFDVVEISGLTAPPRPA